MSVICKAKQPAKLLMCFPLHPATQCPKHCACMHPGHAPKQTLERPKIFACMRAGPAPGTNLGATIAARKLPGGHAAAGEGRDLVRIVDAAHPQHIILVSRVVQRPVQRPIVADCAHHYDAIACDLPHLQDYPQYYHTSLSPSGLGTSGSTFVASLCASQFEQYMLQYKRAMPLDLP